MFDTMFDVCIRIEVCICIRYGPVAKLLYYVFGSESTYSVFFRISGRGLHVVIHYLR